MTYNYEQERQEAIDAGNRALMSLRSAQNNLNSAQNWGIWDMLGGGFISTMAKRSKMDQARYDMEQAKINLQRFSRELKDVSIHCDLGLETGDFLSFADWFFDGFFVDWMVQDKINQASSQVAEAIEWVEELLRQLRR